MTTTIDTAKQPSYLEVTECSLDGVGTLTVKYNNRTIPVGLQCTLIKLLRTGRIYLPLADNEETRLLYQGKVAAIGTVLSVSISPSYKQITTINEHELSTNVKYLDKIVNRTASILAKHAGTKVLVDIENAGIEPGSRIFTIGAIKFDLSILDENDAFACIQERFYIHVDKESQEVVGATYDDATMNNFWPAQNDEAYGEILSTDDPETNAVTLHEALTKLLDFIPSHVPVYARGPDFENSHLSLACKRVGLKWCRRYNRMDDVRSFINGFTNDITGYIDLPKHLPLIKHHALYDCIRDALEMQLAILKYHEEG